MSNVYFGYAFENYSTKIMSAMEYHGSNKFTSYKMISNTNMNLVIIALILLCVTLKSKCI